MASNATSETISLADRDVKVATIIKTAATWSVASAAIPLPWVDLAALAGVQTKMIIDISDQYGQKASREVVRGAVSVLLGTLIPAGAAGAMLSSGLKMIPGLGSIAGFASLAALGAAATYAIGKTFTKHFEAGGTISSFSAEEVTEDLKEEFSKSKGKGAAEAAA